MGLPGCAADGAFVAAFEGAVGLQRSEGVDAHGAVGGGCAEEGEGWVRDGVPGAVDCWGLEEGEGYDLHGDGLCDVCEFVMEYASMLSLYTQRCLVLLRTAGSFGEVESVVMSCRALSRLVSMPTLSYSINAW